MQETESVEQGRPLPQYYRNLEHWSIPDGIKDFDNPASFEELHKHVSNPRSRNFIIDFNDNEAWCGFDFDADAYTTLFNTKRPAELNTRWINIWLPHEQKDLLAALAKHYDFTPRLLAFMCSAPLKHSRSSSSNNSKSSTTSFFHRSRHSDIATSERDVEKTSPDSSIMTPSTDAGEQFSMTDWKDVSNPDLVNNLNSYVLADEIWHYSSVDWGRRYMCLGYNTLHNVPRRARCNSNADTHKDRPHGRRVWSWLLLCEDKTVISISEDPYPHRNGLLTHHEQMSLGIIRRNLINTFRQLSKARDSSREAAQMQLPLRTRLGDTEEETAHRPTDVPGLLFYYLFDDWFNIYSIIARREHGYSAQIDRLRVAMLTKAELGHVDRLHHIGRQLGVLKRLYQGYDMIIDRVLEKQESTLASLKNSRAFPSGMPSGVHSMEQSVGQLPPMADIQLMGVGLSSAARVRFERLKHRITLYALNEVTECLDQKDSLIMVNFNLIAIKESYSVERLTRITLLLAKVTMLFMPVSLMTAYFSAQFKDAVFTVESYWIWFAAIFSASVLGLIVFSIASGSNEGRMLYKPFGKRVTEFSKRAWEGMKRSREEDFDEE